MFVDCGQTLCSTRTRLLYLLLLFKHGWPTMYFSPKYFVTRRTIKSQRLKIFFHRNPIKIACLPVYYRPGCTRQRRNGLVVTSLELHHIFTLVFRLFSLGIILHTHTERIRDVIITYYVYIPRPVINHLVDEYTGKQR